MTFIGLCVVVILSVSVAKGKHLFSQFSAVRAVGERIRILTTYFHLFLRNGVLTTHHGIYLFSSTHAI